MARASKTPAATKSERLSYLLGRLGDGEISVGEFWKLMGEYRLSDADIDEFCAAHNATRR